jgi:peptidoglycan hydrolase CwlO-like protein
MTDVQLYIGIGLPVIAVLASLTVSLVQISAIREDLRTQISAIPDEIREVRADMREIRSDIKLLTGKVYELMSEKH